MLIEHIGNPAMLEQTAEEAAELSQAALKLARYIRGENKVYKSEEELYSNLIEETADVLICLRELYDEDNGIIMKDSINYIMDKKYARMRNRLKEEGVEGC